MNTFLEINNEVNEGQDCRKNGHSYEVLENSAKYVKLYCKKCGKVLFKENK